MLLENEYRCLSTALTDVAGAKTVTKVQILIVEDEKDIAELIQDILSNLGYIVHAIITSGEEAIQAIEKIDPPPDLILMDIRLQGKMDGIEAAEHIRAKINVPIVYLTAYTNKTILERAKITEPSGYLVKPFTEKDLSTTIEMALFKFKAEDKLRKSQQWLTTIVQNIGDAVIAYGKEGIKTFNIAAEQLFGYKTTEVVGKSFNRLLSKSTLKNQIEKKTKETGKFEAELQMRREDNSLFPARINVSTISEDEDTKKPTTFIVVVQDLSETKTAEKLRSTLARTKESVETIRGLLKDEIGIVITYSGTMGPTTLFNRSNLSGKELFDASYRGTTLLMSGINYQNQLKMKYAGTIEISDSKFFTLGFYRAVKGLKEEIKVDPRLKSTAVMLLLVMRKKVLSLMLQNFLQIEEFLAEQTHSWTSLADLTEPILEILHKNIQEFMLKIMEPQREELMEQLTEELLEISEDAGTKTKK